ncbi:MAG: S9 family peptidase, partial [Gemmatimonadetes bacterium]|nr:S9 family peptidase [Gemmatimonadota bacterium]NIQ53842.1 S9 family peptidase [Gemmatimonadota bacterium]NIU74009.1 S9 family peptidase [Gammaproteobacteria bacterium]NIX44078.1 S9 family peptidase [Gemmatimonadota bacterium]NIY08296.1 S9 family peptidase [Gemmatimonadota bacterium]
MSVLVLGVAVLALGTAGGLTAQEGVSPSFRDVLSLRSVGSPAIAPDGRAVAYTVRSADWDDNRYDTEIWLWRAGAEQPLPLTRTADGSSTSPAWSPDGRWLAFLAD